MSVSGRRTILVVSIVGLSLVAAGCPVAALIGPIVQAVLPAALGALTAPDENGQPPQGAQEASDFGRRVAEGVGKSSPRPSPRAAAASPAPSPAASAERTGGVIPPSGER